MVFGAEQTAGAQAHHFSLCLPTEYGTRKAGS